MLFDSALKILKSGLDKGPIILNRFCIGGKCHINCNPTIINHIEQHGYMENVADLQKPPFDKPVSFIRLFDAKTRMGILTAINAIKDNALKFA